MFNNKPEMISTLIDGAGQESDSIFEKFIHTDNIGEYQSEFVKISFDKTSSKIKTNEKAFEQNRDIKKVDLNQLGMYTHTLRTGEY